jgi:dTDP-4-amino-4,6-dideoxygalactose transaminase
MTLIRKQGRKGSPPLQKTRWQELAVFGGPPAFADALHVGRPNIGNRRRFLQRIEGMLDRARLTNNGPYVQEFEGQVAAIAGVRNCVAVCNATIGLEILVRALDWTGEVIVPAFTFVATAHALQWQQIKPVFADIRPQDLNIDPNHVAQLITSRTSGIIGVHLFGRPCDTAALEGLAQSRGLGVTYDAAHGFACSHQGRPIGSFGRAEVFSFHATKFINSLEGGAIVTDDDELARRLRLMVNFGFRGYDNVEHIGTNGKMSEASAAMGLTSLESLDRFRAVHEAHYRLYGRGLGRIPGLELLPFGGGSTYPYVIVRVDERKTGLGRDLLLRTLHAENALARRYFYPGVHRMEPYRTLFRELEHQLPETQRAVAEVLALPTGTGVTSAEIEAVVQIMACAIENGDRLRAQLES